MTGPASLRSRQRELARDAALDAVVDLLEAGDVDEIGMSDVAAAAGLSLRTLYRYFPTRDALLAEAGQRIRDRLGLPVEIGGADDIPASFWAASARLAARPRLARALVRTASGRAARTGYRAPRVTAVRTALAELVGELPAQRARQVEAVIAHLCSSAAWIAIGEESELEPDDARAAVRWALETLLAALHADPAPRPP